MTTPSAALPLAEVDFDGPRPVSRRFGDIYYDADGPAEVRRVFLQPAAVADRARTPGRTFTVAEFGFGTGLNFIVTAAATRSRLHFISFERYPLSRADLVRALSPWRRDYSLIDALACTYPPPTPGWHRRFFAAGRVQLSVFFGDVGVGLADLEPWQQRGVDAWFLDGFAPKRNPEMWREELFAAMAALCAPDATVTTFSAAGHVRRQLAAHRFAVRRIDQMPRKRHSTAAVFTGQGRVYRAPAQTVVVGAGLAGAATARALVDKGIAVRLIDRGEGIARGTSAIPAAVLHPRLLPTASLEARYRLQAFLNAAAWSRHRSGVAATGVLQLAGPNMEPTRLRQVADGAPDDVVAFVDAPTASELAGMRIGTPGAFFPDGLTIDGKALATALTDNPNISIEPVVDRSSETPTVRATGTSVGAFGFLEVAPRGGQLDRFACDRPPRLPIVGDGVFVPAQASVWCGATYEYKPWDPQRATRANAERYERRFEAAPGPALARFRGSRAVTSDHLPVIGEDGGVWFNLGHGSHGTTTATFGAEIIASALNGEAAPATGDILALLEPTRFRLRQERRSNPFRR